MKLMKCNRKVLLVVASLFLLAVVPAAGFGQGRGRGQDKKLDKFVNGHDARDGGWDGRGPGDSRRRVIGVDMRNMRFDWFRNRTVDENGEFSDRGLRLQRWRNAQL